MSIGSAVQRGSDTYVYDETDSCIGTIPGVLKEFTEDTLTVYRDAMVYTYRLSFMRNGVHFVERRVMSEEERKEKAARDERNQSELRIRHLTVTPNGIFETNYPMQVRLQ